MDTAPQGSFFTRHEFLLRRLHSLSGLIPVGAYMCVHLLTNATVLDSAGTFQKNVYSIHSLGVLLPLVEWGFIFIPILFHAIFGFVIIRGGSPNHSEYPTVRNYRYTLQRVSGMIAFAFIMWHVFHMHGWFHADVWVENVAERLSGAQFKAYNATSTAGAAIQSSIIVQILYAIGILACVFHLANGMWTMGITWGLTVSESSQRWSSRICTGFGIVLALVGLSALWGMGTVDIDEARAVEDSIYNAKVASGELVPNSHKRADDHKSDQQPGDAVEVEALRTDNATR